MSNKNNRNNPITFFSPDDSLAGESLTRSMSESDQQVLGLIIKVKQQENGDEQIVNWSFADSTLIKSLAALCPSSDTH
jgi:hypothetical protein